MVKARAAGGTRRPGRSTAQRPQQGTAHPADEGSYNAGLAVFSYIVGGIIVWSLIGWGLDKLFGTGWLVLACALLGAAGGFYLAFTHGLTRSASPASHGSSPSNLGEGHQQ